VTNAPLDLDRPSFLDLVVFEYAGDQPISESYPLFWRKLQSL
jgi:hypothetical protein